MPRSATGAAEPAPSHQAGLSLIELLVVLAILAAMLGAVVLVLPDTRERRLEQTAQRSLALFELACERAALAGRDVGIQVAHGRLGFGHFDAGRFQPVADSPAEVLRPREIGREVRLDLRIDGQPATLTDALPAAPQLACLASGELTPFVLELGMDTLPPRRLIGLPSGRLHLEGGDAR